MIDWSVLSRRFHRHLKLWNPSIIGRFIKGSQKHDILTYTHRYSTKWKQRTPPAGAPHRPRLRRGGAWFNISTSPKCHIILDHLEEYFKETGLSLVKTSDQLIENMHQYFHKVLTRSNYLVKHPLNPRHGQYLLRSVKHLNSLNICLENNKQ